jgi:hypothetical protein
MYMTLRWSAPCALLIATAVACRSSDVINPDHCFILVAQVDPAAPVLQLRDTLTMRATFSHNVSPECLPSDTTAAGLRWISSDPAITVDPAAGRLTALRPGWAQIMVVPVGSGRVLGTTFASVLEPPDADSLISLVANHTSDSATLVLKDATGGILRTVTLGALSSTCWNTALSDSVQYSAQVYLPAQSGPTLIGTKWVVRAALAVTHTWRVAIDPQSSTLPTLDLAGVTPDQGC